MRKIQKAGNSPGYSECLKSRAYEIHEMSCVIGKALLVKLSAVETEGKEA